MPDERCSISSSRCEVWSTSSALRQGGLLRFADRGLAAWLKAQSAGPLIVAVPLTLIARVRRDVPEGPSYVVMTLMFAWFGDTGGYCPTRS